MTRRPERLLLAALALTLAAALAGCTSAGSVASASHSARPSPSPSISPKVALAERLVTQEGLAIALASNVLQTQLMLVQDSMNGGPIGCTALTGGGAHAVSGWGGSDSVRTLTDTVYYDSACRKTYLQAAASINNTDNGATAQATVQYAGLAGAPLGTLVTSATATFVGNGINLEGTGTFTRSDAGKVSLGLACQSASDTLLNCQGGIAQDFSELQHSVGSITPLQLTIGSDVSTPISFTGASNSTAVAAIGALSIVSPDAKSLQLHGVTPAIGAITTSGQAGGFVLFPPTPTGWTVADPAADVSFTINVTDNSTRSLAATVTQLSTKKMLATLALDQSGTGTITYAGEKAAPVASWMLTR